MSQTRCKLKRVKQILCLDYERANRKTYKIFFLVVPTWQIQPQHFPVLEEYDFALGCLDYLLQNPARYKFLSEYLSGYRASEELFLKVSSAQYDSN
ncbi:MAG: hypothetical protein ACFBSE_14370 [Prochloraceae cyanobacterium]